MKVVNETPDEMVYTDANTGFAMLMLVFGVFIYFIGLIPILIMIYYGQGFMKVVGWLVLVLVTSAIWLFYKVYKENRTTIYKINRANQTFEVTMGARMRVVEFIDGFSKLVICGYSIPRTGVNYQLLLVGNKNKCLLNLMAYTKNGVMKKAKTISSFLSLDIEIIDDSGTFQELMELKKKQDLEYL